MENTAYRAVAIVGVGAVLPDAPNVPAFWENVTNGRYSISEVTPERWDPAYYYDPDHSAPDKTYSKIGGFVREHVWDPMKWHLAIPPRVVDAMDIAQKWAIACTREALDDYGYPKRPIDNDRTAVILGNAMAGEKHYETAVRLYCPEYAHELEGSSSFAELPEAVRTNIARELRARIGKRFPEVTEDSMPGELANCIAGRIANIYNFHGPNYIVDAACASAMAAISTAAEGLVANDYDLVVTGGIDRNMGPSTYIKFSKIGALSASGTRPYAEGADGFVMGEGTVIFLMKRLADAERDGDKIYAVLRGIAGSSDGKGKGITAPNPVGQKLAVERAWQNAGLSPATATLFEGHGTSTGVGDVVEVQSLSGVLSSFELPTGSVALGSVKSNIGHLKGAAGAAGLLKLTLALRDKVLPPSVHCEHPNPNIDFAHSPLYVNTELKPWTVPADSARRGGLSAFGFGGTNFHAVLEEYIPGKLKGNGKRSVAVGEIPPSVTQPSGMMAKDVPDASPVAVSCKAPLRGALVIGGASDAELAARLRAVQQEAAAGRASAPTAPAASDLRAPERLTIDYADAADLADKSAKALKALAANQAPIWKALRAQGVFRGHGPAPKVAFLYTGQGSQYANMVRPLRDAEPIVADTFAEADKVMTPLLGKPLSDFVFVDRTDANAVAKAEEDLRQTEITQPAVLAIDMALTRLLGAYGIKADMVMGHSLGEYGALIAAGAIPFDDALQAVSARGRGMTRVAVKDTGKMAAIFAPLEEIERILKTVDGYVVIANVNSEHQAVIGGASTAVEQATAAFQKAGYETAVVPVSHAFHTSIVAGASEPLRQMLAQLRLQSPPVPIVANVTGEFYPTGPAVVPQMLDLLAQQVAAPVQFVKGLHTLYDAGARIFVEVGPKKALQGFAEDVLGKHGDVVSLFTNHPKVGDIVAFNQALCALYAAGLGQGQAEVSPEVSVKPETTVAVKVPAPSNVSPMLQPASPAPQTPPAPRAPQAAASTTPASGLTDRYMELGHLFADVLERGLKAYQGHNGNSAPVPVVITGAAVGLPGTDRVFDDANVARILRGDQFIKTIPPRFRQEMLDKHILRLVKSEKGEATFESISDVTDVIKLAGRGGAFDLNSEFGVSAERLLALDQVTRLAIAVGIDAMRDAGIPLVMRYKTTSKGTQLPDRWGLPDSLRDDTGVIMGSAFPGYDAFADEMARYYADHARREELAALVSMRGPLAASNGSSDLARQIDRRIEELRAAIEKEPYVFDRRFLLRTLSMGHSQFAEFIGARGPNTQINSACATTTQAVGLAEDWIRAGRCRRVIIISADDVTSDHLIGWMGSGFLASGAAATDEVVEEAATPFDRRRHGLIMGMGAAAIIVESAEAARERGIQPICEVLSSATANSAFHGTRLDVQHICGVMEKLIAQAEAQSGIQRGEIAPRTVFVSHETYTPARGGSASAEIHALRHVFGDAADQVVIANTKGMTGHAMATGIEDVVAVKALETGFVPPVANFKEIDPELGALNLSKGGAYPVEYALRLGAGFGSQVSMTLVRWVPPPSGVRPSVNQLGYQYRIVDPAAWNTWLTGLAGYPTANLEVVQRTLRVRDQGPAARLTQPAQSSRPVPAPVPVPPAPPAPVYTPSIANVAPKVQVQAAAAVPAAPPKPVVVDAVKERILELAVEKTGYPRDMLDLDLDMEADLGVDTVKQAEIFAAIREIYSIPRDENRKLRDFPTLAHVIRFVYDSRPDLRVTAQPQVETKQQTTPTPAPALAPAPKAAADAVQERILDLAGEKTGYPRDMLDLDLDMEADLGVDTVKQAEIFAAIREIYNIPRDENRKLRDFPTLAHVIRFVYDSRPDLRETAQAPAETKQQAAPTPPAPAVTSAPRAAGDAVRERILALAVEKTGYPRDMLDLDLDLEADLGVDTVKQAEMFAAIREIYSIPRDENRKLRDFPTLAHVIQFVYDSRPDLRTSAPPVEVRQPAATMTPALAAVVTSVPRATGDAVKERILDLAVEKTGYPRDMLDLELDLEADLGVDTVKQAEMFAAIREIYNIPRDENRKLRDFPTLAHVIQFVYDSRPDLRTETSAPAVETKPESKPVAPVPVATPAPQAASDPVKERILDLAVEKTGYPRDMLDLELDLEADLGVDTVKQAEMFAAIREIYSIPRDENRKLRDFPTLAHVIQFVYDSRPDLRPETATPMVGAKPETQPTAPAPVPQAAGDPVKERILDLAVEKTGYPRDMLDLELDLEADLGVDTVKQAEMFAAIREIYSIPRDENRKLRDFPTLAHVIQFVYDNRPDLAAGPISSALPADVAPVVSPLSVPALVVPVPVAASFDATNRVPRRVPVPALRPHLSLCKPTGVTLGSGSRVVIMPDKNGVSKALAQLLKKKKVEVLVLDGALDADALTVQLNTWVAAGPIQGIYWLPALEVEQPLADMDLATWREALRVRVKSLYTSMRVLYEQIAKPGTFLVSATALGGQHGYDEAGSTAPLGGAVVGFTKTYKRERIDALVKAVDFDPERKASKVAETLIEETLRDPGAVEVGYKAGQRWTVGLQEQPAADGQPGLTLSKESVFLITGAAGSIVSAITADLAAASGGIFYLLDLVPEPDANNPDIQRFVSDKDGLKRDLFARMQARGERATPALVEKELAGLERAQAARSAIDAVHAAGGTAHYFSVNLTDAERVTEIINQVRERSGRIDVLLHAAGIERSHFLPDKDPREFDLVFDVKSDGWFNLLHAIGDMPLGATVGFSSVAGRFGNAGQADYSAANDLLCKTTSSFRTTRPATRGIVIDWTAWGGIGMATRGSIPKMMELAGIDMLPAEAGIPLIRRELTTGGTRGEIVIGLRLGVLLSEWDSTGGLDADGLETSAEKRSPTRGPIIGKIAGAGIYSGLTVETVLDPKIQPFLYDHQIDGTPVLPGVMGIEAFAEAAQCLLPGWQVGTVEDVNFLAAFKFYRNEPRTVTTHAIIYPQGDGLLADCRLIGSRTLPSQAEPQLSTHFTGRVRLVKQAPQAITSPVPNGPNGSTFEAAAIYSVYFHGPAYHVLERAWRDGNRIVGLMAEGLPVNHQPSEQPTLMAPRLIELCFQTAGLWEISEQGRMGLPLHVHQVCALRAPETADGRRLLAVVTPNPEQASFDAEVLDTDGNRYVQLIGYRTVALPNQIVLEPTKALETTTA